MKKMSLIVLVAIMAFAANVFAQEATKPAGQEQTKTTEAKKAEAPAKTDAKATRKHHKKGKKSEKKEAAPEKK